MKKLYELSNDQLEGYAYSTLTSEMLSAGVVVGTSFSMLIEISIDGYGWSVFGTFVVFCCSLILNRIYRRRFKKILSTVQVRTVVALATIEGMRAQIRPVTNDPFLDEWEGRL